MKLGIVGLPFSGKTFLFEAITGAHKAAADFSVAAHTAAIAVPDERLDKLAAVTSPRKVTRAHVDFMDVPGVEDAQGRERNVAVLSTLREADGLVHVVRFFDSPGAPPHPHGSLDPARDVRELETELLLADLDIAERRVEKLEKQIRKGGTPHQDRDKKELAVLLRVKEALEEGTHISAMGLSEGESRLLRAYKFLSEMPMLYVLNVHEDALNAEETKKAAEALGPNTVAISARIEKEISELGPDERQEFIEALGFADPASRRVIRASYEALGLRSFFTGTDPDQELRAWTVRAGENALAAAGKIHTDIARGFIRAEVCPWEDVLAAGSSKHAKAQGKARLEGKDYVVQDGDVILFRFNV